MLGGKDVAKSCRTVDIMADAAYVILTRDSRNFTGNFVIDEDILREEGCRDFAQYACVPGHELMPDFFLDDEWDQKAKVGSKDCASSGGSNDGVSGIFEALKTNLNEDVVKRTNAIFAFNVKGFSNYIYSLNISYCACSNFVDGEGY